MRIHRRNSALFRAVRLIGPCAALGLLIACPKPEAKAPQKPEAKPAAPAPAATTSDAECIAAWNPEGAAQNIEVNGRTYVRTGTKLSLAQPDADDQIILGVVANIKEDTPENLKNLAAIVAFFKQKNAEAIVVAGDLGEDEAQITNALQPLAATGLPVFSVIGNREKKSDYNKALAAVSKAHPNVFDLGQLRLVNLDDVALVSMPGYYDKAYIHAEGGCQYQAADVTAGKAIAKAAGTTPVVLVSHGPPRQDGSDALDRTLEQANVGDPWLVELIRDAKIKLGIFSNIQEAGGRATDLGGAKLIPEKTLSPELFLNPGAADAVSWQMNDGTRSVGMAAIMTVKAGQASFEIMRILGGEAN